MEALSILRLSVSPRRNNNFGYMEDDIDELSLATPFTSAPSSPRRAFTKEVEEAPLGEVLAAIPFAWELTPGTPKRETLNRPSISYETEETMHQGSSTSSNCTSDTTSTESLSRESSNTEFEFSSRFVEPPVPATTAEDLFSNGKLVPSLRLPPRLQNLRYSDSSSCSEVSSSSGSFKSFPSPQGSVKVPNLCGFTMTTDEEMTVLGMQERKHRPLSPLRFLNREHIFSSEEMTVLGMQERKHRPLSPLRFLNREHYFSSDSWNSSVSTFSPSSASGGSTNADSPQDSPAEKTSVRRGKLKELMFTDMAMATGRNEQMKPRRVQSRMELLKEKREKCNGFGDSENVALTPQLSRSNAKSRRAPIDIHAKENVGRAVLSNRFGMLCSCLGILPESP